MKCKYMNEQGDKCEQEAKTGFPCCDNEHGFYFKNWSFIANNWETLFCANPEGYINEMAIANIPCEVFKYYQLMFNK